MKKRALLALMFVGMFLSSVFFVPSAQAADGRDCDDNAVIRCGALSESELNRKCWENQNGTIDIFRALGIQNCDKLNGLVEGRVTADNKIYVGNDLVATDAVTAGRHNMPGSTPIAGGIAHKRPPSVSFVDKNGSLRALVKMDGKTFRFAVITSCGNPVMATPVSTPPPPPPTVTPTVQPTPPPPVVQKTVIVNKEQPAPPPPPPPPPSMPVTGFGNTLGIFVATIMGGVGGYQLIDSLARRYKLK